MIGGAHYLETHSLFIDLLRHWIRRPHKYKICKTLKVGGSGLKACFEFGEADITITFIKYKKNIQQVDSLQQATKHGTRVGRYVTVKFSNL